MSGRVRSSQSPRYGSNQVMGISSIDGEFRFHYRNISKNLTTTTQTSFNLSSCGSENTTFSSVPCTSCGAWPP